MYSTTKKTLPTFLFSGSWASPGSHLTLEMPELLKLTFYCCKLFAVVANSVSLLQFFFIVANFSVVACRWH